MAYLKKSPWVFHYDASSCNWLTLKYWPVLRRWYDIETLSASSIPAIPRHADIFLVTGRSMNKIERSLKTSMIKWPTHKFVVAIGICATSGGIFRTCYNVQRGIDKLIR